MKSILERVQLLLDEPKPQPDKVLSLLKPLLDGNKASWPVYHYMGIAWFMKDQFVRAETLLREALHRGSDEPETWLTLAVAEFRQNKFEESLEHVTQALVRRPDFFKALMHKASVLHALGRLNEALRVYQQANHLEPRNARIAHQIGLIYSDQGILDKALELLGIAIQMDPSNIKPQFDKAALLTKMAKYAEAGDLIDRMLTDRPDLPEIRVLKAELFKEQDLYDEAVFQYEELLQEYPHASAARVNYGLCLQELARFDEAEKQNLLALQHNPNMKEALSNYLMVMHYNPARTREHIFKAHARWDELFAPKERPERPTPANRDPHRKLRVGFISGGFRGHPVGWMITTALENLDPSQFEIVCYTTNNITDDITRRIIQVSVTWKSVLGYDDTIIAGMIRQDEIDILVELSGHASDNRLRTIALEPAPILVKWVGGLFNTSGLRAMDYLITDWHETPAGEEPFYTEKLVRMPGDYISFLPPSYAPEVGVLPASENGFVTFGCFNNPSKVNQPLLDQWAEIMHAVPGSRLLLKSRQYRSEQFKERIRRWMAERGIDAERLLFEGRAPHQELLGAYNRVDIALDPWPYSGGLSTCEALWMGVPVVTLPGPTFAGRHSATHLINAGLPGLVARNWEAYVGIAVGLASDLRKLAAMRVEMREQVRASALCDAPAFGRDLGAAFRAMWGHYVAGADSSAETAPEAMVAGYTWTRDHIDVRRLATAYSDKPTLKSTEFEPATPSPAANTTEIRDNFEIMEMGGLSVRLLEQITTNGRDPESNFTKSSDDDINKIARYRWVHGTRSNLLVHGKHDIVYSVPNSLEVMTTFVMLEQGEWFDEEVGFMQEYLVSGMRVLDVGAGFGAYALGAAAKVGRNGHVYAFEPVDIMRKHLDIGKVENGVVNLEVSGKALASITGKMGLVPGATPELTELAPEGNDIQVITLDSWWDFAGNPVLDVVKIDVNGQALDVLKGAGRLLAETSPIVLIAAQKSDQKLEVMVEHLASLGYMFFDFVGGLGLLITIEDWGQRDAYAQNVVAAKTDRVDALKHAGWIHDENVEVSEPEVGYWKTYLSNCLWTTDLMDNWTQNALLKRYENYYRSIDYICTAQKVITERKNPKFRSAAAVILLSALENIQREYNSGETSTSLKMSLIRILVMIGQRSEAVVVMHQLMQQTEMGRKIILDETPFLLPYHEMESVGINTDYSKWFLVRMIESWLKVKNLTGYNCGLTEKRFYDVLVGNPERSGTTINSDASTNLERYANSLVSKSEGPANNSVITIGIPCYNEAAYIEQCLSSVLNQKGNINFALVIADNGSTDGTVERIKAFLNVNKNLQSRTRLILNSENNGPLATFSQVYEAADTEFFMWLGAHDCLTPDFLLETLPLIQGNSECSMASGIPLGINSTDRYTQTEKIFTILNASYDFTHDDGLVRYIDSIKKLGNCTVFHSIFRKNALRGYNFKDTPSGDHIIISRLLWQGKLLYSKAGYIRRYFPQEIIIQKIGTGIYSKGLRFFTHYCDDFKYLIKDRYQEPRRSELLGVLYETLTQRFGNPQLEAATSE